MHGSGDGRKHGISGNYSTRSGWSEQGEVEVTRAMV